jgi:hypothetical protein
MKSDVHRHIGSLLQVLSQPLGTKNLGGDHVNGDWRYEIHHGRNDAFTRGTNTNDEVRISSPFTQPNFGLFNCAVLFLCILVRLLLVTVSVLLTVVAVIDAYSRLIHPSIIHVASS